MATNATQVKVVAKEPLPPPLVVAGQMRHAMATRTQHRVATGARRPGDHHTASIAPRTVTGVMCRVRAHALSPSLSRAHTHAHT